MNFPDALPEPDSKDPQQAREAWLAENRAAMDTWNDYVEEHGVPLAAYRSF